MISSQKSLRNIAILDKSPLQTGGSRTFCAKGRVWSQVLCRSIGRGTVSAKDKSSSQTCTKRGLYILLHLQQLKHAGMHSRVCMSELSVQVISLCVTRGSLLMWFSAGSWHVLWRLVLLSCCSLCPYPVLSLLLSRASGVLGQPVAEFPLFSFWLSWHQKWWNIPTH